MVLLKIYDRYVKAYNWDLNSLDNTNLETLFDYLFYKDPNVRIINGKQYRRTQGAPKWL